MTAPYYQDATVTILHGDCLDVLRELPDNSVDSVCTDPPYGLEFMGKEWDSFAPQKTTARVQRSTGGSLVGDKSTPQGRTGVAPTRSNRAYKCRNCAGWSGTFSAARRARQKECFCTVPDFDYAGTPSSSKAFQAWCELWAAECLRVLKPGGHMLSFGGTRTWHRLVCAVEDSGFEIRDSIAWLYGSGFPKSRDVSKAIDKAAGAERDVLWAGWGTALKPAHEPIVVARKPIRGTVAANVQEFGTGALNIDGCRIDGGNRPLVVSDRRNGNEVYGDGLQGSKAVDGGTSLGRWPANVILDSDQAAALDEMSGELSAGANPGNTRTTPKFNGTTYNGGREYDGTEDIPRTPTDSGGASRYFLTVEDGCAVHGIKRCTICLPPLPIDTLAERFTYTAKAGSDERITHNGTAHPTVKPLTLMRWLVRLVTPPGGTILEPFAGSGTTVEAALLEGFKCIAIEREADYLPLITQRIHRRRDPVAYLTEGGHDLGLFGEDEIA